MEDRFIDAFAETIREQIVKKNQIAIKGLGSFYFKHRNQHQKQFDDGRVVMMPPKDQIKFTPANGNE